MSGFVRQPNRCWKKLGVLGKISVLVFSEILPMSKTVRHLSNETFGVPLNEEMILMKFRWLAGVFPELSYFLRNY